MDNVNAQVVKSKSMVLAAVPFQVKLLLMDNVNANLVKY